MLWASYVGVSESRAICQMMANHTTDKDLRETIEHFVDEVEEPMMKRLAEFMVGEGMALPPTTGDRPQSNESAIPPGARMTDLEVANLLVVKLEGMLTICHTAMLQSVRSDVAQMFYAFQSHLLAQGATLKGVMRRRGWLRLPPAFHPEASAVHG